MGDRHVLECKAKSSRHNPVYVRVLSSCMYLAQHIEVKGIYVHLKRASSERCSSERSSKLLTCLGYISALSQSTPITLVAAPILTLRSRSTSTSLWASKRKTDSMVQGLARLRIVATPDFGPANTR